MPPDIKPSYDDNNWWTQTMLIVYQQIREHEEMELLRVQIEASIPRL